MPRIKAPTGTAGNFVPQTQKMAKESGFSRISQIWYDNTNDWEWSLQQVHADHDNTDDIHATHHEVFPVVHEGRALYHYNNRYFEPTPFAYKQLLSRHDLPRGLVDKLLGLQVDENDDNVYSYEYNEAQADAFVRCLNAQRPNSFNLEQKWLWRTNKNGSLRALLTSDQAKRASGGAYAIIDNRWLIEALREIMPEARVSHWKGNSDTTRFNVFAPDSAMENNGEGFGGGVYVKNSEIGELSIGVNPFLYRFVCMNGNVWGRENGEAFTKIHRGKVDYNELATQLKESIVGQLGLIHTGIETLINTQTMGWDGASLEPVFSQLGKQFKMSRKMVRSTYEKYSTEVKESPANEKTLFGLLNSVTRAAHDYRGRPWEQLSEIAGDLLEFDKNDWSNFKRSAKRLKPKDIESFFPELASTN